MPKLPPLTDATMLRRYKRFLADVRLPCGEVVTAHCPNTGAMRGCWKPGAAVQLSQSDNPKRKLRWTLERVDMGGGWIGVNTIRVNAIVSAFIAAQRIAALSGYTELRREPKYATADLPPNLANARFDLLLQKTGRADCYLEIKNTTLLDGDELRFPDAVSVRGTKHLELLQRVVRDRNRGVLVFAANRPEGKFFRAAADIDPDYAAALQRAHQAGVEILALRLRHTADGVELGAQLPLRW